MQFQTLARDSTNVIELTGFRDRVSGAYPENATATVTLYDPDDVEVPNAVDIDVSLVASGVGAASIYRGELPDDVVLERGTMYLAVLTVDVAGKTRTFYTECQVLE